jgi:cyclomaltodextrinase / maltogenic alpha-amylase / neopullulanase
MNYLFTRAAMGFFIRDLEQRLIDGTGYEGHVRKGMNAKDFGSTIQQLLTLYSPEITGAQLNLLDSHDTARYLTTAKNDQSALRLATLFQMCYPGAPCIYYGDEIGLEGAKDPDCRRAFPWQREKWDTDLLNFFKRVIDLRHDYPTLRRGSYDHLYAEGNVYVFGRSDANEKLVIALNVGSNTETLPPLTGNGYIADQTLLLDIANTSNSGEKRAYRVLQDGNIENFKLPPRSGVVLEVVKLA